MRGTKAGTPEADELLARHRATYDDLPLVVDERHVLRNASVAAAP